MSAVARVVIRTDATATIGAGHAMRCLALAGALRRQGAEVLLYGDVGAAIAERYAEAGATLVEPAPGEQRDRTLARNRLAVLLSFGGPAMAWAVFDGYGFDADDHAAARRAGARVLVVDDYGHLPCYDADIILNQNISADAVQYAASPACILLRGLRYVLLRQEFEAWGGRSAACARARAALLPSEVLVSMGGADPGNATLAILQALPGELLRRIRLHLLVGPHNPHRDSLLHWVQVSGVQAVIHSAVRDMPALLAGMDMAVTAAGSTCWELMCMGLPFVTVVLADNQRDIAGRLDAEGVARSAGTLEGAAPDGAARAAALLGELLDDSAGAQDRVEMAMRLADGRGALRVAGTMLLDGHFLRPVVAKDCEALWRLANDPSARAASFNSAPIKFADHCEWLARRLVDPDVLLFLLVTGDDEPVGYVRFEQREHGWVVSVALAPDARGKGLGSRLIASGSALFCQRRNEPVTALVKADNAASLAAFRRAGYVDAGERLQNGLVARSLLLREDRRCPEHTMRRMHRLGTGR